MGEYDFDLFDDIEDEFEELSLILEYVDDDTIDTKAVALAVENTLSQFTFDELLDINELDEAEVLAYLWETGYIGLPRVVEDEEVEDNEAPF